MRVIRKPERQKQRSTQQQPNRESRTSPRLSADGPAGVIAKWKNMTMMTATPRRPSRAGIFDGRRLRGGSPEGSALARGGREGSTGSEIWVNRPNNPSG